VLLLVSCRAGVSLVKPTVFGLARGHSNHFNSAIREGSVDECGEEREETTRVTLSHYCRQSPRMLPVAESNTVMLHRNVSFG